MAAMAPQVHEAPAPAIQQVVPPLAHGKALALIADASADELQRNEAMDAVCNGVDRDAAIDLLAAVAQDASENSRIRSFSVQHLGLILNSGAKRSEQLADILVSLLGNSERGVRREAFLALSKHDAASSRIDVDEFWNNPTWYDDRDLLIRHYVEHGRTNAGEKIRIAAVDDDASEPVRIAAIAALGEWKEQTDEDLLRQAMSSKSFRIRRAAALALKRLGAPVPMEEPPTDVWRVAKSFEIGAKSAQAAALVFERTELAAKVGPTETSKAFEFAFKNHGARTVRINDITSTCGCISVNADTKTVAPGESGKITAVLDIGTLSGDYRQDILITSDDPGLPQTYLTIRAQVEPVFIVQPSAVKWSKHAENLPKMIQVRVNAEVPVTELRPPNDDDFAIEVSKGQSADGDWVISIRPKSQKDLVKSLVFSSDAGIGRRSSFKIVVVVQ